MYNILINNRTCSMTGDQLLGDVFCTNDLLLFQLLRITIGNKRRRDIFFRDFFVGEFYFLLCLSSFL